MAKGNPQKKLASPHPRAYSGLVGGISELLEIARRASARTVNAFMTATYWEVGRRIVEFEQAGQKRAEYGEALLARLAEDLTAQFGRGFSQPAENICSTLSSKLENLKICQTPSGETVTAQKRATASLKSPYGLKGRPAMIWAY